MYVLDKCVKYDAEELTDKEFLAQQIVHIKNIFLDDNIAIKDINLNYVALSNKYIETFNLNNSIRLTKSAITFDHPILNSEEIRSQELKILEHRQYQDSFLVLTLKKKLFHYVFRKRPLINPATQNVVGLLVMFAQYKYGILREKLLSKLYAWFVDNTAITLDQPQLTDKQQQVLFCLSIGYHSRKEIAVILSQLNNGRMSEQQVKYALQGLYEKFECCSTDQILKTFTKKSFKIQPVFDNLAEGEHIIE